MRQASSLIPLVRVTDLMQVLRSRGHTPAILKRALTASGLDENLLDDPKGHLSVDQAWRLFSANLTIINDELTGQDIRPVPVGTFEIIVSRIMHAETIRQAIEAFARTSAILYSNLQFSVTIRHDELHFSARFQPETTFSQQIMLELTSIPLHCTFSWLAGSLLNLQRYRTSSIRAETAAQLSALFGCPVEFGGEGIDLVYNLKQLEAPIADRRLENWRHDIYEILISMLEQRHADITQSNVSRYLKQALRNGVHSEPLIASSLGMSGATLRRRLKREQTTFRELRDEVLKEDAGQMIQAGATIEVISEQLGYSEPRSFRRAFERCFGMSPKDYRDSFKS